MRRRLRGVALKQHGERGAQSQCFAALGPAGLALGRQANVDTLPIVAGQQPVEIAQRALQAAKLQGYDVLLLDTAGRLHVDDQLMAEMKAVAAASNPVELAG